MKWGTSERPKIDRIARSWLIGRFIDPTAELLYVSAANVLKVAAETPPRLAKDEHEMLRHGMTVCDALCAWCRACQAETHRVPPQMG